MSIVVLPPPPSANGRAPAPSFAAAIGAAESSLIDQIRSVTDGLVRLRRNVRAETARAVAAAAQTLAQIRADVDEAGEAFRGIAAEAAAQLARLGGTLGTVPPANPAGDEFATDEDFAAPAAEPGDEFARAFASAGALGPDAAIDGADRVIARHVAAPGVSLPEKIDRAILDHCLARLTPEGRGVLAGILDAAERGAAARAADPEGEGDGDENGEPIPPPVEPGPKPREVPPGTPGPVPTPDAPETGDDAAHVNRLVEAGVVRLLPGAERQGGDAARAEGSRGGRDAPPLTADEFLAHLPTAMAEAEARRQDASPGERKRGKGAGR
jgi:hypothetical protein